MQNDLEITSESQFWTQNMQNSTKTLHSDMSGRSAGSWGTVGSVNFKHLLRNREFAQRKGKT